MQVHPIDMQAWYVWTCIPYLKCACVHVRRASNNPENSIVSHGQAKEALGLLDQAGLMFRPDADVLCLRGECCSALGNNAMVRRLLLLAPPAHSHAQGLTGSMKSPGMPAAMKYTLQNCC